MRTFKKTFMKTLSQLTDYEHSNMYVHQAKLHKSIVDMKELFSQQYKTKIIEIPPYILRDEIKKANKKMREVNYRISCFEQTSFNFGL
jgi:hypothetical protein